MHIARKARGGFRSINLRDSNLSFSLRKVPECPSYLVLRNNHYVSSSSKECGVGRNATESSLPRIYSRDYASTVSNELPEARGVPVIGTILPLMMAGGSQKLHEYVDRRHRELGPIYREQIGPVRAVFVNSPDDFRRIFYLEGPKPQHFLPDTWLLYNEIRAQRRGLFFMDGDEWLHFRRILNRAMLKTDTVKGMCVPCQEAAENLAEKWRIESRQSAVILDLENQLYQWSIEVMLATLMGSQWHDCKQQIGRHTAKLACTLHRIFEHSGTLSIMPARLAMKLRVPAWNKFVAAVDTALRIVHTLVPEMKQLGGDGLLKKMTDYGITGDDITRIVADFILAAGDTTAVTMQWALLLLSDHSEMQQRLFESIKDLSPSDIVQHQLLNGVIKESLRLYPVAPFITRYMPQDNWIGNYLIPEGELLILSIYSSGRDVNNFPQPNDFRPDRWIRTKENRYQGVINSHATLPFAMGARSCIGRKLAETQLCLALAQLIKRFNIECKNRDNISMILHLVSVPSKPIKLKLTKREIQ